MDNKVELVQKQVKEVQQETATLSKKVTKTGKKTEVLQRRAEDLEDRQKEIEDNWIKVEMERAAFMLRFQNIPEGDEEDLRQHLGEGLGPLLEMEPEAIKADLDLVYRINSRITRQRQLPREVHVRFTKRQTRDKILKMARKEKITIKGAEINVLKEIPWSTRKRRKEYQELTSCLRENEIYYTWLIPEGVSFMFEIQRQEMKNSKF